MKTVRDLLTKLRPSKEDASTLPGRTSLFPGSNPRDASSHPTKNLPVFPTRGGFNLLSNFDGCTGVIVVGGREAIWTAAALCRFGE